MSVLQKKKDTGKLIEGTFSTFYGRLKQGKKHGFGSWTGKGYLIGQRYEGEWAEGLRHGRGTFKWADGDRQFLFDS